MNATAQQEVHESKWGYHPCSRETYKKLKRLNWFYQQALHDKSMWERWHNKDPHNRLRRVPAPSQNGRRVAGEKVIWLEPQMNPVFLTKEGYKSNWTKSGGYLKEAIEMVRAKLDDHGVPNDRARAGSPVPQEAVRPLRLSLEEIDRMLSDSEAWLAAQK
jgi:hypothetical protein